MAEYLVYVDCKPDGTPFYVGKGKYKRVMVKGRDNAKHKEICAQYPAWYRGIAFMGNEQEAYAKEIELIAKYDNLANKTLGGGGTNGVSTPKTDEWKEKLSKAANNQWGNESTRQIMVEKIKLAHNSEQTKQKMREIGKARDLSKSALSPYLCVECGHINLSRWVNVHQANNNHVGKVKL